ncbi:MAG: hypothetical protein WA004_10295 [Saprospiraceae bacterium]
MADLEKLKVSSKEAREQAQKELGPAGGLTTVSRTLASQLQLPNLKYFGSEKDEDLERREDWLAGSEFASSRLDMKKKLTMLVDLLESSDDVAASAQAQKEKIEGLKDANLSIILDKARPLEKTWRELALFYTNAAERELRNLVVFNANVKKVDEDVLVKKLTDMITEVNSAAIDMSKNFSMIVAPNFVGRSLIEKLGTLAYKNKALLFTDYQDLESVDAIMEAANEEGAPKLGGVEKVWSRTVVFTNYGLLRDKHKQERRMLFGSPAAAVAGKMYSMENLAQPVAGAQFGPLKGFNGLRFRVNMDQTNMLDEENLNPLTLAFGSIMPFNCLTLFKGQNVELRQYSVIRTLDYVDKILKHFLNQYVFTSMLDSDIKQHVYETILRLLKDLEDNKILKKGRITYFNLNEQQPDRFDITLSLIPMFVTSAFDYTIGIDTNGLVEGEENA